VRSKVTSKKSTIFLFASIVVLSPFDLNALLTSFYFFNFSRGGFTYCDAVVTVEAYFIFKFTVGAMRDSMYALISSQVSALSYEPIVTSNMLYWCRNVKMKLISHCSLLT